MKDNYAPVPGRTPEALFNKIESIGDILYTCDYLSAGQPSNRWQLADSHFMKAILCFVYESCEPEEQNMAHVRTLIEMELEENEETGNSELYELMRGRKQFTKEHGVEEEYCTFYYQRFCTYPKNMREAIAKSNLFRFGFDSEPDQRRRVVIF